MKMRRTLLPILFLALLPLAAPALAGDEIEVSPSVGFLQVSPVGGFLQTTSMNARGEVLVTWANDAVRGRRIAPDDTPLGPEFQISEQTSDYILSLSASIDPRGFSVVWDQEVSHNDFSRLRRFDAAGEPVAERMDVGSIPMTETDPRGRSVVVGGDNAGKILGYRFDAAGNPVGTPVVLAEPGSIFSLQVAVDGRGNFVVVWKNVKRELLGRRFDKDGQPRGPVFRIARAAEHVDLAGNGKGSFVALWTTSPRGLWAQSFSPSGEAFAPVLVASGVAARDTIRVSVAMDAAGRFLATWGGVTNFFGRFFEASGTPLDLPFRVGTPLAGERDFAADAAGGPAGQFFVTWLRVQENGTTRLIGRRLRWPGRP
jgi:hypothetical protein